MDSSSGTISSSRSSGGSEEDVQFQIVMDQKKRKRMISNRESARRSRMKKQKHLDELTTQIAQIRNENNQIAIAMNATTQLYMKIDADNSILRTQVAELSRTYQSLSEIVNILNAGTGGYLEAAPPAAAVATNSFCVGDLPFNDAFFNNSWNLPFPNGQLPLPLMTSVDMFHY